MMPRCRGVFPPDQAFCAVGGSCLDHFTQSVGVMDHVNDPSTSHDINCQRPAVRSSAFAPSRFHLDLTFTDW